VKGDRTMEDDNYLSRAQKYKKRRSVTRSITLFSLLGVLLVFGLIITLVFGKKEEQPDVDQNNSLASETTDEISADDQSENNANESTIEKSTKDTAEDSSSSIDNGTKDQQMEEHDKNDESDKQEGQTSNDQNYVVDNHSVPVNTVSSDDPNVISALEGDWQPIGTNQLEPHEVVFEKESDDWAEMVAAIESVVKIDSMIIHWLGNGGVQKAIATVSEPNHANPHRVYLSWVPEQGWQPTRVEQLERLEVIKYQSSEESD